MIYRYILKEYLKVVFSVVGVFSLVFFVSNFFDALSRFSDVDLKLSTFLLFLILKIPYLIAKIAALISLISSVLFVHQFTATNQIIPILGSGKSIIHIAAPVLTGSALLSFLNLFLVAPIGSILLDRHDVITESIFSNEENTTKITNKSIMLIENSLHAKRLVITKKIDVQNKKIYDATIVSIDSNNNITSDYLVPEAKVENGKFIWPDNELDTKISLEDFTKHLSPPENNPIWILNSTIQRLKNLGFNVTKYTVHYYAEILKPIAIISGSLLGFCFINLGSKKNNFSIISKNIAYTVGLYVVFSIISQILSHRMDSDIISTLVLHVCIFMILSLLLYRISSRI